MFFAEFFSLSLNMVFVLLCQLSNMYFHWLLAFSNLLFVVLPIENFDGNQICLPITEFYLRNDKNRSGGSSRCFDSFWNSPGENSMVI
jgi:hypothetical protein